MSRLVVLSWNIQSGRGADGRTDLDRIGSDVRNFGTPDIICLQEVARHMPGITANRDVDQAGELAKIFAEYFPVYRPSVDAGRHQFGCMVLSRHPVLRIQNHLLPRPNSDERRSMQRQALEVTIDAPGGVVRVTTTQLEFHSSLHRSVQVKRLRDIHQEVSHRANGNDSGLEPGASPYCDPPRVTDAISCGDYNFLPDSNAHFQITASFKDNTPALHDAWQMRYAKAEHPDTCGLSDEKQWPQGPHCRDYFFVSGALGEMIETIEVDQNTRASDHQPVRIQFERPA